MASWTLIHTPLILTSFPLHIIDAIRALAKKGYIDGAARQHRHTKQSLDEELRNFRKQQGIPGLGKAGFVLFGHAKKMWD